MKDWFSQGLRLKSGQGALATGSYQFVFFKSARDGQEAQEVFTMS